MERQLKIAILMMRRTLLKMTASLTITAAATADTKPSRETIERHIDPAVQVNGKYAAVRLPITNGPALWNPSRITITPEGLVFVANYTGEILTLHDTDGDGLEDTSKLFVDMALMGKPEGAPRQAPGVVPDGPALRYPTALTYRDGWLYVGTTQAIHRFRTGTDGKPAATELFASGWPYSMHAFDWTFGMRFGKDGCLYAILCTDYLNPKAAPDPEGLRGSIIRISPDGKKIERFAYGLRFPYGLAINDAGDVFFTDNRGSDQNVTEELNHAVLGGNYGHNPKNPNSTAIAPILNVKTDASPVGCSFNPKGNKSFGDTAGDLFIACWGNDGAWDKGGIARVRLTRRADGSYDAVEETFSVGPAKLADLDFSPNGDMYAARFGREAYAHAPYTFADGGVYRFIHAPWLTPTRPPVKNPLLAQPGDPEKGKEVFAARACITCHSVDRSASMMGPDLKDIALTMSREGLLESIIEPGKNIKTDYDTNQITRKNGETLVGCVGSTDAEKMTLRMAGGVKVDVLKADIAKVEILPMSLMPPGLVDGTTEGQKNDLFAYLESLAIDRTVRINAGGPAVTIDGIAYRADAPYEPGGFGHIGGLVAFGPGQPADAPNASCRYENFAYRFDCANGDYEVTLSFAEHWFDQPGQRIFSVLLNGQPVLTDLDLAKESGLGKPFRKTFCVTAAEGRIDLTTTSTVNFALINAIEIRPAAEP